MHSSRPPVHAVSPAPPPPFPPCSSSPGPLSSSSIPTALFSGSQPRPPVSRSHPEGPLPLPLSGLVRCPQPPPPADSDGRTQPSRRRSTAEKKKKTKTRQALAWSSSSSSPTGDPSPPSPWRQRRWIAQSSSAVFGFEDGRVGADCDYHRCRRDDDDDYDSDLCRPPPPSSSSMHQSHIARHRWWETHYLYPPSLPSHPCLMTMTNYFASSPSHPSNRGLMSPWVFPFQNLQLSLEWFSHSSFLVGMSSAPHSHMPPRARL